MDIPLKYEKLIRKVFSCKRLGDPARLANAGHYRDTNLRAIKSALYYVSEVALSKAKDGRKEEVHSLQSKIDKAKTVAELNDVVLALRELV